MKRKRTQYILSSIGVVILLLALFTSFYPAGSQEGSSKERGLEKFQVTHPVKKDTSFVAEYIASLQAIQHVELRSRIKGVIEKIHIDEGQLVKKNDILFTLSQQEFETELLQAKAALNSAIAEKRSAEVEMKNTKELVDKGIESPTQLEIAEARIDALQAKVEEARSFEEQAKLHLNYTTVRAPFDGVIGRIPNKVGSLEEEGTLLTTISDNSQMYAYFNVSEKEYLKLTAEQKDTNDEKVTLLLANQKAYEHQGKIQTLDNMIKSETGTISFRALFDNPDRNLIHGASGKVQITKQVKNALLIPQVATVEAQDILYVYVVDEENILHRRKVNTLFRLPHLYVVESGLSPKDQIVYKGMQHIQEGMKIETEVITFLPQPNTSVIAMRN